VFPKPSRLVNQCLTMLLHIGAWVEKADPFYDITSHNIYVMSIPNDIPCTTSFSEAYLSCSHIQHQPTFLTKPWARREHSPLVNSLPRTRIRRNVQSVSLLPPFNLYYFVSHSQTEVLLQFNFHSKGAS
jgi:hypothetical protein